MCKARRGWGDEEDWDDPKIKNPTLACTEKAVLGSPTKYIVSPKQREKPTRNHTIDATPIDTKLCIIMVSTLVS